MKSLVLILALAITATAQHIYPSRENNLALFPGTTVSASSTHSGFIPESAINGDRLGNTCGPVNNLAPCGSNGGWWNDNTYATWPDWHQTTLNRPYALRRIAVTTFQDEFNQVHEEPYLGLRVGGNYTIEDFEVVVCTDCQANEPQACGDYVAGTSTRNWIKVAEVEENIDIIKEFTFNPILAQVFCIVVHDSYADYSRIVEVEAFADAKLVSYLIEDKPASALIRRLGK